MFPAYNYMAHLEKMWRWQGENARAIATSVQGRTATEWEGCQTHQRLDIHKNPCLVVIIIIKKSTCLNMNIISLLFHGQEIKYSLCGGGVKGGGGMGEPSYHYNSMSWASSSEKSDIELSDEESPAPSSCSFRASSVAYFWMYSVEGKREGASAQSGRENGIQLQFCIQFCMLNLKVSQIF